jgi:hypothetical protein
MGQLIRHTQQPVTGMLDHSVNTSSRCMSPTSGLP